jgi:hypothetical protein
VAVLRSKHLQESDRFGIRLNSLTRTVGHIDNRDSSLCHCIHAGAFRNQVQNHGIVATGRGIMKGRETTETFTGTQWLLLRLGILALGGGATWIAAWPPRIETSAALTSAFSSSTCGWRILISAKIQGFPSTVR